MNRTANSLKIRIHTLEQRDSVRNANIINKLKRRLRAIESK